MSQPNAKPTYKVAWSRFTGKYEANSSSHPGVVTRGTDPFIALADLHKLLALMDRGNGIGHMN